MLDTVGFRPVVMPIHPSVLALTAVAVSAMLASAAFESDWNVHEGHQGPCSLSPRVVQSRACSNGTSPHKSRRGDGAVSPEISVRVVSILRRRERSHFQFDGWIVLLSYKFNRARVPGQRYQVWYSDPRHRGSGIAKIIGVGGVRPRDRDSLERLPRSFYSLRESITFTRSEGLIGLIVPASGYVRLRTRSGMSLLVLAIPPATAGDFIGGKISSNRLAVSALPR